MKKKKREFIIFDGIKFFFNGKYFRSDSSKKNRHYLHRYVWEFYKAKIPSGYVIHHKDHNPKNNHIDNLKLMTNKEHATYHAPLTCMNEKWLAEYNSRPPPQKKASYPRRKVGRPKKQVNEIKKSTKPKAVKIKKEQLIITKDMIEKWFNYNQK